MCCRTSCSGAFPPPSCVLACYWSMVVCYWGISQSQTTTQLAGIWAPLATHRDPCEVSKTGNIILVQSPSSGPPSAQHQCVYSANSAELWWQQTSFYIKSDVDELYKLRKLYKLVLYGNIITKHKAAGVRNQNKYYFLFTFSTKLAFTIYSCILQMFRGNTSADIIIQQFSTLLRLCWFLPM